MRKYEFSIVACSVAILGVSVWLLKPSIGLAGSLGPILPSPASLAQLQPLSDLLSDGNGGDTVVEALDYQCPPCHSAEQTNVSFRMVHPTLSWRILQFPLGMHNHAYELSLDALQAVNEKRFPELHTAVMSHLISPRDTVARFIQTVDPKLDALCSTDKRLNQEFKRKLDAIRALPIDSTPTFFAFRKDGHTAVLHSAKDLNRFFANSATKG